MSVVVWDGKTLAADREGTFVDTKRTIQKLWLLEDGDVIAMIGSVGAGLMMKQWYEAGANPKEWPKFQDTEGWVQLIVATANNGCYWYDSQPARIPLLDPFAAWGCGREVAVGAMAMGADAVKAVEVVCEHISGCGRGCDSAQPGKSELVETMPTPQRYDKPLKKLSIYGDVNG